MIRSRVFMSGNVWLGGLAMPILHGMRLRNAALRLLIMRVGRCDADCRGHHWAAGGVDSMALAGHV